MSRFNVMPRAYRRLYKPSLINRILRRKPPTITFRPVDGKPTNPPLTLDTLDNHKR